MRAGSLRARSRSRGPGGRAAPGPARLLPRLALPRRTCRPLRAGRPRRCAAQSESPGRPQIPPHTGGDCAMQSPVGQRMPCGPQNCQRPTRIRLGLCSAQALDLGGRPLEDLTDALEALRILEVRGRRVGGARDVLERLMDLDHRWAEEARREPGDAIEDLIDGALVLLQVGAALGRDLVDPLPIALGRPCVPHLLEHGERGIDRAGAGRVRAAEPLLERLDDLVTVPRLVAQQLQDHVLEIPLLEHPPAEPAALPARTRPTAPRSAEPAPPPAPAPAPTPARPSGPAPPLPPLSEHRSTSRVIT